MPLSGRDQMQYFIKRISGGRFQLKTFLRPRLDEHRIDDREPDGKPDTIDRRPNGHSEVLRDRSENGRRLVRNFLRCGELARNGHNRPENTEHRKHRDEVEKEVETGSYPFVVGVNRVRLFVGQFVVFFFQRFLVFIVEFFHVLDAERVHEVLDLQPAAQHRRRFAAILEHVVSEPAVDLPKIAAVVRECDQGQKQFEYGHAENYFGKMISQGCQNQLPRGQIVFQLLQHLVKHGEVTFKVSLWLKRNFVGFDVIL